MIHSTSTIMSNQQIKEESGTTIGSSLFSETTTTTTNTNTSAEKNHDDENEMENFAEQFKDKVKLIHEHFDKNQDGYLNYHELSNLQECTSGQKLDSVVYGHICSAFSCRPEKGLSLDGLKLTYASEGSDLDEDYEKIFGNKKDETSNSTTSTGDNNNNYNEQQEEEAKLKMKIHPKVKAIHDHFDTNRDGYLNYDELSALQSCTSEQDLDGNVYHQLCVQFGCDPNKGLSIAGLNLVYATEVTDIDEDYEKVFGSSKDSNDRSDNVLSTEQNQSTSESEKDSGNNDHDDNTITQQEEENNEEVFEVGDDGWIDISPDS